MPQLPRASIPGGPQGSLRYPSPAPSNIGERISNFGESISGFAKAKQDIQDTIEANDLLAEHSIQARQKQSEILRSDRDENAVVPDYEKELQAINQDILGRARSENVRQLLQVQLPQRSAGKINEMQQQSDARFVSKSLAGYETATQKNAVDYASAQSDADRQEIRQRQLSSIEILASRGVFDADNKAKEVLKFNRGLDLFDAQRAIQNEPALGVLAITNPKEFLKKFPNLNINDLDDIFTKSVQIEERRYQLMERKKKELREAYESTIDEAGIRGKLDFDVLNKLRDKGVVGPETYRRNATMIQKQFEEGGLDDPDVMGELSTRIRLNPFGVSNGEIVSKYGAGLSRKGMNELLDLKQKWQKSVKEDAESGDPRMKGVLFREGKEKIDQTVGKGITISGINVDDNTRRRWAAAVDIYLERVNKERDKSQIQISNEVVEQFQGAGKPGEFLPQRYRSERGKAGVNWKMLEEDFKATTDPNKKRELKQLIDRLKRAVPGDY